MEVQKTEIPDLLLLKPKVFGDARGFFMESYNDRFFKELGISHSFVQDNHSSSSKGILRGLHYQIGSPQGKLVRVVRGAVFDVAVDMRKSSKTFGKWVGVELSEENKQLFWIPPGFAHGFLVLSERADFLYKTTDFYSPKDERCLLWNDPTLNIHWPLFGEEPILSDKDRKGSLLGEAEIYTH